MKQDSNNIIFCPRCKVCLIMEELEQHTCRKFHDIWAIDGKFWIGDGIQYYPLKSPTQNEQPDRNNRRGNRTDYLVEDL